MAKKNNKKTETTKDNYNYNSRHDNIKPARCVVSGEQCLGGFAVMVDTMEQPKGYAVSKNVIKNFEMSGVMEASTKKRQYVAKIDKNSGLLKYASMCLVIHCTKRTDIVNLALALVVDGWRVEMLDEKTMEVTKFYNTFNGLKDNLKTYDNIVEFFKAKTKESYSIVMDDFITDYQFAEHFYSQFDALTLNRNTSERTNNAELRIDKETETKAKRAKAKAKKTTKRATKK